MNIDRRDFLKRAGLVGGAAAASHRVAGLSPAVRHTRVQARCSAGGACSSCPATESKIDHVVVVMMENRSFDHWLGWLADDHAYLDAGRRRYGRGFSIDGLQHQTIQGPTGPVSDRAPASAPPTSRARTRVAPTPTRATAGTQGRAQRDGGFLAPGSDNDDFATGYYIGERPTLHRPSSSARFTTFDRYHASLLGPTYPNREYLHSAQSGGHQGQHPARERRVHVGHHLGSTEGGKRPFALLLLGPSVPCPLGRATRRPSCTRRRTTSPTAPPARCRACRSSNRSSSGPSSATITRLPTSDAARRSSATRSERSWSPPTGTPASSS